MGWRARYLAGGEDRFRVCLVAVDVQNTFCVPGFELFVAGRSGTGAVDDSRRLCEFIYRNSPSITCIVPTMDTHHAMQIFHPIYLIDERGEHPASFHARVGGGRRAGHLALQRRDRDQPLTGP